MIGMVLFHSFYSVSCFKFFEGQVKAYKCCLVEKCLISEVDGVEVNERLCAWSSKGNF